ncbi:MAG: PQQ-like beta-propeller repeat protein [Anaerolineales bacterium]|nr:PQQ-like beta-propeller repeat protein [Anaerolineales bacterium]MCB8954632.1 PQQ-like beta-propeller repeat protein [Ardenticatenales bacterium]
MYTEKRLRRQPAIILFIIAAVILSACSGLIANANWPGITVQENVVYVAYGAGVAAFDIAAGTELWNFPTETEARISYYAAPSVENSRIVIGDYGAPGSFFSPGVRVTIYALETGDGGTPTLLWSSDTLARDRIVAPPLQVNDVVYIGTADNFLLAIDATNGAELWRFEAGHSIWAQPVFQDGTLYVVSLDKKLYALDAETGAQKWEMSFGGSIINTPAVGSDLLYLGTFDNKLHAVDLATGEERWSVDTGGWAWSGPTLADGVVYEADLEGNLYALDAETGDVLWSKTNTDLGEVQASPVVVNDAVIFAAADKVGDVETRQGTLLALNTADGSELWRERTPARIFATPVVADEKLVVVMNGTAGLVFMYDLSTGRPVGSPLTPSALAAQN